MIDEIDLCFILTMWYVNPEHFISITLYKYCFILTMWYVNQILCSCAIVVFVCFILTMWYVNEGNPSTFSSCWN